MSIFSRFRDIVNSNINAMLDGAEDPEKLVRLMIQEMEDTLIELKASCAGAIAARKKTGRALDDLRARVANWESKAKLAISKGREDLAREALNEKRRATEGQTVLDKETMQLDEVVRGYQTDIGQLEEKLTSAREKQRVLVQRHIRAGHHKAAQHQIRKSETADALLRYEQFENRIERMEAEADLVNYGHKPSLEEQFAQLERDEEIEKELKALKEQQATGGQPPQQPGSESK
ncbi:MAG: phage shock protein PspA [Verrucomicrobia bacterium]|nr:phage shock protein PspA [Verrucomicrobiota bacterium]MBV9657201.1 phage shock protein PspA [Verrucomicrobiota bacterium]